VTTPATLPAQIRLLLLAGELHKVGFERLRVVIGRDHWFRAHLFAASDGSGDMGNWPASRQIVVSSGVNAAFLSETRAHLPALWTGLLEGELRPRHLVGRFILDFPDLAHAAYGADQEYARWYRRLMPLLLNDDPPCMYGENMPDGAPEGTLPLLRSGGHFPAPPKNPWASGL
jgi:hypothetical protein